MLKVIIPFIDKNGNQQCLLEEKETLFYYLVNRMGFANWLFENYEDLDCDIHAIIDHLVEIEK